MPPLPPAAPLPPSTREQRILALTGGGVRGLFTIAVLQRLQEQLESPLRDYFSVLSGTSIGGIIAIALACGIEPQKIQSAFDDHCREIFTRRWWTRGWNIKNLFVSPYGQKPLRRAIVSILGDQANKTLGEITVPLIVVAVERDGAKAKIFASKPLARDGDDLSVPLIDVALATSAAPTYFPPHRISDKVYIDGGLIANAPDLIALQRCIEQHASKLGDLYLLSVGTAGGSVRNDSHVGATGGLQWLMRYKLFDITIEAQSDLVVEQAKAFLDDRFFRIDAKPAGKIPLDSTAEADLKELKNLSGDAVNEFFDVEGGSCRLKFFANPIPK